MKLQTIPLAEGAAVFIEAGYYGLLSARKGRAELVTQPLDENGLPEGTLAELVQSIDRIRGGRAANRSRKGLTKRPPES
jgi:hypothetical protein